jgi:hypothetical protein
MHGFREIASLGQPGLTTGINFTADGRQVLLSRPDGYLTPMPSLAE